MSTVVLLTVHFAVNAAIGMMCSCAHPHNEPPTDAKLGTADDNGGGEVSMCVYVCGGGDQWVSAGVCAYACACVWSCSFMLEWSLLVCMCNYRYYMYISTSNFLRWSSA